MKTLDGTVHTIPMQLFKTDELTEGAGYRFNFAGEIMLPSDESGVVTEAQLPEEFSIDWVDRGEHSLMTQKQPKRARKRRRRLRMREIKRVKN